MTSLMGPRTFIQRELPSRSCSRLSLQALRTRVRTTSSGLCQKTNHACTAGSALHGKPIDTSTRLETHGVRSARSDALHGGGAMAIPAAPKLAHGKMLVLWRLDAFLLCHRMTASLLLRFAACTGVSSPLTERLEPPPVSTPKSRFLLVTPTLIPSSSSPLRSNASVLTLEYHMVDLGEMTWLSLSQANVMISAASTICLVTSVWRPTAHGARCWST